MKKVLLISLSFVVAACNINKELTDIPGQSGQCLVSATTKSGWAQTDKIAVVPADGSSMQVSYSVKTISGDGSATFDGGAWGVKNGKSYVAYCPYQNEPYFSSDTLSLDLNGQSQALNADPSHIKAFDLQYAGAVQPQAGVCHFDFDGKLCLLKLNITTPDGGTFSAIELSSMSGFPTVCLMKLSDGTTTMTEPRSSFRLELDNIKVSASGTLVAYLVLCPMSSVKETLVVRAVESNGNVHYSSLSSASLVRGDVEISITVKNCQNEAFSEGESYSKDDFSII